MTNQIFIAAILLNASFLFIVLLFAFEIQRNINTINKRFYKLNKILSSLLLYDIQEEYEDVSDENVINFDDYQ